MWWILDREGGLWRTIIWDLHDPEYHDGDGEVLKETEGLEAEEDSVEDPIASGFVQDKNWLKEIAPWTTLLRHYLGWHCNLGTRMTHMRVVHLHFTGP